VGPVLERTRGHKRWSGGSTVFSRTRPRPLKPTVSPKGGRCGIRCALRSGAPRARCGHPHPSPERNRAGKGSGWSVDVSSTAGTTSGSTVRPDASWGVSGLCRRGIDFCPPFKRPSPFFDESTSAPNSAPTSCPGYTMTTGRDTRRPRRPRTVLKKRGNNVYSHRYVKRVGRVATVYLGGGVMTGWSR
jgi:hypothetical protein